LEPFAENGRTIPWEQALARFVDATGRPGPATWTQQEFPPGEGDFPVSGVSWFEAAAYARFAGKTLPTAYHWAAAAEPRAARWIAPLSNFGGRGASPASTRQNLHLFGGRDMAGNVKEWTATDTGSGYKYILGGGWDDPVYAFNDPDARNPFDRTRTFGFRCVKYSTDLTPPFLASLPATIRDFRRETPASAAEFELYRRLYRYDASPLDAKVTPRAYETADWRREEISVATAYGSGRMRIFLFLPRRGTTPFETVVFFPASNVLRTRTIEQLPMSGFEFVLKSGRAVALPEFLGTLSRATAVQDSTANDSTTYSDHVVAWIRDFSRAVDYLETRPDLRLDRLAMLGVSWGGRMGAIVPALDSRVRVQVLVNGGFSLQRSAAHVDQFNFASRVTIPTLMLNGRNDFYFPIEASQKPMFEAFRTPKDQKDYKLYDGGHNMPRAEMIKETLAWLDRFQPVR
jgi:dienelactone hydrolase